MGMTLLGVKGILLLGWDRRVSLYQAGMGMDLSGKLMGLLVEGVPYQGGIRNTLIMVKNALIKSE